MKPIKGYVVSRITKLCWINYLVESQERGLLYEHTFFLLYGPINGYAPVFEYTLIAAPVDQCM